MTRDEEILTACKGFLSRYPSIDQAGLSIGFLDGAIWSDKNPQNVWHDPSEEPKLDQWFLAQIGDDAFDTFIMAMDKNKKWRNWCKGINIKRWAYINDLLPKGCEKLLHEKKK